MKSRDVSKLPRSVQEIIRDQMDEANSLEQSAVEKLKEAIAKAEFNVDGEHLSIRTADAKTKIDQALEYLVSHVYSKLDLITKNAETDADILAILTGNDPVLPSFAPDRDACAQMEEYLEM